MMILNRIKVLRVGIFICVLCSMSLSSQEYSTNTNQNETGFVSIFDGKSLKGWDGDPIYWRVEEGKIVGEITPKTIIDRNTFLIWIGGEPKNFELKLDYKISSKGNSGINYRSKRLNDAPWSLQGYQADIDGKNEWSGQNYEERGRTFLALRGQVALMEPDQKPKIIGVTGSKEALTTFIKNDDWNEYYLIVRDNIMIHMINGHVMSVVIDDDKKNRVIKGYIGVQVHVGPPMKVEYRDIRLKEL